jgi:AraC-like DNA-binding protein
MLTKDPALLRRLLRAKDAMDKASDQEWPVTRLAKVCGVSAAHFARSFKDAFGVPPHRYLLTRRIERAKAMLRETELAITAIAFQTGWQSLGTFGRIFRDVTGASPGEVRASSGDSDATPDRAFMPECFFRAAHRPILKTAVSEKRRREAGGKKGPPKQRRSHEPRRRSSRSVRARPG